MNNKIDVCYRLIICQLLILKLAIFTQWNTSFIYKHTLHNFLYTCSRIIIIYEYWYVRCTGHWYFKWLFYYHLIKFKGTGIQGPKSMALSVDLTFFACRSKHVYEIFSVYTLESNLQVILPLLIAHLNNPFGGLILNVNFNGHSLLPYSFPNTMIPVKITNCK